MMVTEILRSWDSVVGIASGYGLDGRGVGVRVPVGHEFSLFHVVQTGSGIHPSYYPTDTGGSFPEGKAQGRETDRSPPTSSEVKEIWIYTSTTPYAFIA
jgi:hypothetical protein